MRASSWETSWGVSGGVAEAALKLAAWCAGLEERGMIETPFWSVHLRITSTGERPWAVAMEPTTGGRERAMPG